MADEATIMTNLDRLIRVIAIADMIWNMGEFGVMAASAAPSTPKMPSTR